MEETISRKAAIDAVNSLTYPSSLMDVKRKLIELPPAEPNWIPCSVRMPEEHEWIGTKRFGTTKSDEVYVTFENPKGERFCMHLSFQNGKLSAFDQSTIDAFFKGSRPIAWMPLPEAWKGEANDAKMR